MAVGDKLDETVGDLEIPGRSITYPLSPSLLKHNKFKYDFHVKKEGYRWVYVDSTNEIRRWYNHKRATEENGGRWRVVESATAEVVEEGGNEKV